MKKLPAIMLALALGLGLTACVDASAISGRSVSAADGQQSSFELRISTTQTDSSMIFGGLQAAADRIMEETGGDIKVTVYPSSQLGAEEDVIDQAVTGMGVAVLTDAGRMSNYVHDIGIFNAAYFVDSYEDGLKVIATPTFRRWEDELLEQGVRVLCFNYYDGARSFMTQKPVTVPADLAGVVIRTPGAEPYNQSIAAMGAVPYNIAWNDVYNSIQLRAIDGCEVQYTSAVSSRIYEVCEYIDKTEHIQLFNCLICGEKWFSQLPPDYQKIILDACYDCAYENALSIADAQTEMENILLDNGMELIEPDLSAFKDAVKPAYEKLGWTALRAQLYKEAGLNC